MKLTQKQLDYLHTYMKKQRSNYRPVLNQFYYDKELGKSVFTDSIVLVEIKADNMKENIVANHVEHPSRLSGLHYPNTERLWNKSKNYYWERVFDIKELKDLVKETKEANKQKKTNKDIYILEPGGVSNIDDKYIPWVDIKRLNNLLILAQKLGIKKLKFSVINSVRPVKITSDIPEIKFLLAPIRHS